MIFSVLHLVMVLRSLRTTTASGGDVLFASAYRSRDYVYGPALRLWVLLVPPDRLKIPCLDSVVP